MSLADICPNPLIIQTDWNPEAEHGATYELVGDGYKVDADAKKVTGPLVASGGKETGIDVEIRIGGPAIGFQQVTAQMYAGPIDLPRVRVDRRVGAELRRAAHRGRDGAAREEPADPHVGPDAFPA